jgi:hypothetical protein
VRAISRNKGLRASRLGELVLRGFSRPEEANAANLPPFPFSFVAGPPGFYECQCKGKAVGDKEVACGVQRPDLARAPWRQVSYHGINATLMRHLALLVRAL